MMKSVSRITVPLAVLFIFSITVPCAADDLRELSQQYGAAKPKVRGGKPEQRLEKAKKELGPILKKIVKLDTPEALGFVRNEFDRESPEIAAACVEPLLSSSNDKVLEVLLGNFQRRPQITKLEILKGLAKTKREISSVEKPLINILKGEKLHDVRREVPDVLAKIGTLSATKALLTSLPIGGRLRGREWEQAEAYKRRIVGALKKVKTPEVTEWLSGEAFSGAPAAKLLVLARLAGELKLKEARPEIEKLLDSSDEAVAVTALEALEKIGSGPSAEKILSALKKGKRSLPFRIQALDALAAAGTEESLQVVVEAARDSDPDTRSIALGSLAHAPGSSQVAFDALIRGLEDESSSVRIAAIRGLNRMRNKSMVPALINAMEREREERLKIDILKLLITLTGKNMGLVIEDWRKWWEIAEPRFEFAKDSKDGKRVTMGKAFDLKYFGIEVTSKRLDFLVDISSSMTQTVDVYVLAEEERSRVKKAPKGVTQSKPDEEEKEKKKRKGKKTKARKIDVLKKELARVISVLPRDAMINIVSFDANYKPWQKTLQPLAGAGRQKALGFVRSLNTGQGTNVFDTLEFGLKDSRVDTIFLLTDGLPTRGRITDPAGILREVRTLNRVRGVTINCIAFGAESKLLEDLAKENGGEYRFVDSY